MSARGERTASAPLRRSNRATGSSSRPNYREEIADSESEEEWVERLKPVSTARKGRKKDEIAENIDEFGEDFVENNIFHALSSSDTAIVEVASDFLDEFSSNKFAAIKDILNFVLRSCGSVCQLEEHDVTNFEASETTIGEIQYLFSKQAYHEYPLMLASTTKNSQWKNFKKNALEFIQQILEIANDRGTLYQSDELLELIIHWLASMSTSTLRPLRYTATTYALEMETTLCKIVSQLSSSIHNYQIQLDKEKKRKSRGNNSKQIKMIESNIAEYSKQRDFLHSSLKDIFLLIFDHRYRDTDPAIRQLCVSSLNSWINIYPEYFSGSSYIKYFGYLLTDPRSNVRSEVVKVLIQLFRRKDTIASLDQFASYFKSKLVDMAVYETDFVVRFNSLILLNLIVNEGYLEEDETIRIAALIYLDSEDTIYQKDTKINNHVTGFSPQLRLNREVAKFIISVVDEKFNDYTETTSAQIVEVQDEVTLDVKQMIKIFILLQTLQKAWNFYSKSYSLSSEYKKQKEHNIIEKKALAANLIFSLPPTAKKGQELEFFLQYLLFDVSSVESLGSDLQANLELGDLEISNLLYFIQGITSLFAQGKSNAIFNALVKQAQKSNSRGKLSRKTLSDKHDDKEDSDSEVEHDIQENDLDDDIEMLGDLGNVKDADFFTNKIIVKLPSLFDKFRSNSQHLAILLSIANELMSTNSFTTSAHDVALYKIFNSVVNSYRETNATLLGRPEFSTYYSSLSYLFSNFFKLSTENYKSLAEINIKLDELLLELTRHISEMAQKSNFKKAELMAGSIQKIFNLKSTSTFLESLDFATSKVCESFTEIYTSSTSSADNSSYTQVFQTIFLLFAKYNAEHLEAQVVSLQSPDLIEDLDSFFESHTRYLNKIYDCLMDVITSPLIELGVKYSAASTYCDIQSTSKALYDSIAEDENSKGTVKEFYRNAVVIISPSDEKSLQRLFFIKEDQLAKVLNVSLERDANEDVFYEEADSFEASKEDTWELEKELTAYVLKIITLFKLGMVSKEFYERLSLNSQLLGDFYMKVFKLSITSATIFYTDDSISLYASSDNNKAKNNAMLLTTTTKRQVEDFEKPVKDTVNVTDKRKATKEVAHKGDEVFSHDEGDDGEEEVEARKRPTRQAKSSTTSAKRRRLASTPVREDSGSESDIESISGDGEGSTPKRSQTNESKRQRESSVDLKDLSSFEDSEEIVTSRRKRSKRVAK